MQRLLEAGRRDPLRALTWLVCVAGAFFTVVWPLTRATHPPLTDLPFHAANVSIVRNYFDPAYRFHEQFTLHPLESPYITMYAIGALAALVFPIQIAIKIAAAAMLALLPLGLALLCAGLKKHPLWGVLGLGLVWGDLTHWGFLSFVGALGLYAACVGAALLVLDRPSVRRRVGLGALLVLLFFTHVFRFPFAVAAIVLATVLIGPTRARIRPLLAPVGLPLAGFVIWLLVRAPALGGSLALGYDGTRWQRAREFVFASYLGASGIEERRIAWMMLGALAAVIVLSLVFRSGGTTVDRRWRIAQTLLPLALALGHALLYFVLPSRVGEWWYVYPRELPTALFFALAAVPDLPPRRGLELGVAAIAVIASGKMAGFVRERHARFDHDSRDFREISALLPPAPRLLYLIIDHGPPSGGPNEKRHSPYVHLPAWVQAEKGGSLSFHFAGGGLFPIRYRADPTVVPPPVPRDWEWNPSSFRAAEHAQHFDWFLVRLADDPAPLFEAATGVTLVERRGMWWLYKR